MALSKEQTYFARLCRCVLDVSGHISRDILMKQMPPKQLEFNVKSMNKLTRDQKKIVRNVAFVGDYRECDITAMYTILRNYCPNLPPPANGWSSVPSGVSTSISDDIERIRSLRNEVYGHTASASISEAGYKRHMQMLRELCNRMDIIHSDYLIKSGNVLYEEELESIETCCMDVEFYEKYTQEIQKMYIQEKEIKAELENIKTKTLQLDQEHVEMKGKVHMLHSGLTEVRRKMEEKDNERVQKFSDEVTTLKTEVEEIKHKSKTQLEILRENTESKLCQHRKDLYVHRETLEEVCKQKLEKQQPICIVSGQKGMGKSSLCHALLSMYENEGYHSYIVEEPSDLSKVQNEPKDSVVLIDDSSFQQSFGKIRKLEECMRHVEAMLSTGNFKFLVAIKQDTLVRLQETMRWNQILVEENIVNMTKWKMNVGEKREMYVKYKSHFRENVQRWSVNREENGSTSDMDRILNSNPHYGFAQTCKMFFTSPTCFRMGASFFLDAHDLLSRDINSLFLSEETNDNIQYLILTLILFKNELTMARMENFASQMRIPCPDRMRIDQTLRILENSEYIQKTEENGKFYEIKHKSIFEAMLISVGKYFPIILLSNAETKMMYEFVCSAGYKKAEDEICCCIPADCQIFLAKRLLEHDENALNHRTLADKNFAPILLDQMYEIYDWADYRSKPDITLKDIFIKACKTQHLHHLMAEIVDRLCESEDEYADLLKEGICTCVQENNLKFLSEFDRVSPDIRHKALYEAIKGKRRDAVVHLTETLERIDPKLLLTCVKRSSNDILKVLADKLKANTKWLLDGLSLAIPLGKKDMVETLLNKIDRRKMENTADLHEIFRTGLKDVAIFKCLCRTFFDLMGKPDVTKELFEHSVSKGHLESTCVLLELFDVSLVPDESMTKAFHRAIISENVDLLRILCLPHNICRISDKVLSTALESAIKLGLNEIIWPIMERLKVNFLPGSRKQDIFLLAASESNPDIVDLLLADFLLPTSVLLCGIRESVLHGKPENAKSILRHCDNSQMMQLHDVSQKLFVEVCKRGDIRGMSTYLAVFDRGQILDDTLQEGLLLSVSCETIDALGYLLEEIVPTLSKETLQDLIITACRCGTASRDKLSLIFTHAHTGIDSILDTTRKDAVFACIRSGNSDSLLCILDILGEWQLPLPEVKNAIEACIESNNHVALKIINGKFGFSSISDETTQALFSKAVDLENEIVLKCIVELFGRSSISRDTISSACTEMSRRSNCALLKLLLDLFGACSITEEVLQICLITAFEENNQDIVHTISNRGQQIKMSDDRVQQLFEKALRDNCAENVSFLLRSFDVKLDERMCKKLFEMCCNDTKFTRVVLRLSIRLEDIENEMIKRWIMNAIVQKDSECFSLLIDKVETYRLEDSIELFFLSAVSTGQKEMMKTMIVKFDYELFSDRLIQEAFMTASDEDNKEILHFLLDKSVFGTRRISKKTLSKTFMNAIRKNNLKSLDVMLTKFDKAKLTPALRAEGLAIAQKMKVYDVVEKLTCTCAKPQDKWIGSRIRDDVFSSVIKIVAEQNAPGITETLMDTQDKVVEATDLIMQPFKDFGLI